MKVCVFALTRKFDAFSQAIGKVRKDYHHAKLQRGSLPQVKVFQKLVGELGNSNSTTETYTGV